MSDRAAGALWQPLPGVPPSLLGESPAWLLDERVLVWTDIPGKRLNEWRPADGRHRQWPLPCEAGSLAPMVGAGLLLAMRDGLWRFDRETAERTPLARAPYDTTRERFNDGRADAQGRFWVSTIYEPRDRAAAALYRFSRGRLDRMAGDITVGNGLAFSPDGRTLYWSDTKAHLVQAFDTDLTDGSLSRQRVFARFAPKGVDLVGYGGRPDGAAVDCEGAYWVAMFEGQRVLRLSPAGEVLAEWPLPVRCPTMPCFGGDDLRSLFVTTARENRPADELAAQPLAGCVLTLRVEVPGLPVNYVLP